MGVDTSGKVAGVLTSLAKGLVQNFLPCCEVYDAVTEEMLGICEYVYVRTYGCRTQYWILYDKDRKSIGKLIETSRNFFRRMFGFREYAFRTDDDETLATAIRTPRPFIGTKYKLDFCSKTSETIDRRLIIATMMMFAHEDAIMKKRNN